MPLNSLGSLPRVPPHLAAAQAAAWAVTDCEAMFVLTSGTQQGVITPGRLQAEMADHPTLRCALTTRSPLSVSTACRA
jgi:hypothetical protein